MDNEVLGLIVKELNKNGVKLIKHDFSNIDTFSPENADYYYIRTGALPQIFDFSEHDKVFEDKIVELENIINHKLGCWDEYGIPYKEILDMKEENQELKRRIAELESKETVELPFDALETANMLINATYKDEIPFLEKQVDRNVYDIDDLEQIAEHLLVYCKHNRDGEE